MPSELDPLVLTEGDSVTLATLHRVPLHHLDETGVALNSVTQISDCSPPHISEQGGG